MELRKALGSDMPTIDKIALRYDLDSNDTKADQFIVAVEDKNIIGFGRLLPHAECIELGTIGVVEEHRKKGVAKRIIGKLLKTAKEMGYKKIYLTTLVPSYFEKFGFRKLNEAPPNCMIRKKEWCEGCTKTGCTVMKMDI